MKAKQAKKLKEVRSVEDATKEMEFVEEAAGVESSRTPGVESLEDPSRVGSLEDSRVGSLEDSAKRDIETRQESFLEINQKLKTKQPEQQKDSSVVLNDNVPTIKVKDNVNYISNKEEELEAIHSSDDVWEVATVGEDNITVEAKTLNGWGYCTPSLQRFNGSGLAFVESTTGSRNERSINKKTETLLEQIMNKR